MIKLLEHTRKPDITFNRNGIIQITSRLARALSLCPGDAINISIPLKKPVQGDLKHSVIKQKKAITTIVQTLSSFAGRY